MDKIKSSQRPLSFWIGVGLIVLLLIGASAWLFWPTQSVLFSDLAQGDAAQITAKLDKQKLAYTLSEDGGTIYMAPDLIPKARLQVFSDKLDLKSGVGLEVFSGSDLGMTEFSQHVNYVRALQGELTRTLLTIEGVESARVHIAMPEGSARRRSPAPAVKVAITLDSSAPIAAATVRGVQRFVTAAVPGVEAQDVVILDGKGSLLTSLLAARVTPDDGGAALGPQLEQKAAIESYLEKKAGKLLQNIVPAPGHAEVIVDVSLSENRRSVTREELIPSGSLRGLPVGLLQKGHFNRKHAPQTLATEERAASAAEAEDATEDAYEFASGKQIEHIENPVGAVQKISVSVVIVGSVPLHAEEALQRSLSRGLGLDGKRGDDVAILILPATAVMTPAASAALVGPVPDQPLSQRSAAAPVPSGRTITLLVALGLVALVLMSSLLLVCRKSRNPEALAGELRSLLKQAGERRGPV